ncbi:MAG: catalase [Leptospira sp.]|nr:catalase [Leptospira sp.]
MKQPSKEWKETILPTEEQIFQKYSEPFRQLQRKKNSMYGKGRGLHRKQLLALKATFEVLKDIPAHAKFGLFAKPNKYDATIRLSNGGMDKKSDSVPDIRGFSIKVNDVKGDGALGKKTSSQDFLLINHAIFSLPDFESFINLVLALGEGMPSLIKYLFQKYGFLGGFKKIGETAKTMGKPFTSFATENFHSAAPISCGPYAVKVRLNPSKKPNGKKAGKDWAEDFSKHLAEGELSFDFQLQFFVDPLQTPIEDPTVEWPEAETPFVTVGRLTIPIQNVDLTNASTFALEVENSKFDPWNALLDHKPLGQIMRARKHYYFQSQQERS